MTELLKYPSQERIEELLKYSPNMKVYRHFNEDGNLVEQFELRKDVWYDVTDREKAKQELEKAKQDLGKHFNYEDDVIDFSECEE